MVARLEQPFAPPVSAKARTLFSLQELLSSLAGEPVSFEDAKDVFREAITYALAKQTNKKPAD